MGSTEQNLLQYFRSRTQVDIDSFDVSAAQEYGPYADATSNQCEVFSELSKECNDGIVKSSIKLAIDHLAEFEDVNLEELAVEIAAIQFAFQVLPYITGAFHVMANPRKSFSIDAVYKNGLRYHQIAKLLDATFDRSRMVMKVASTWEGLQACRQLKEVGIKTLATTVFTMEQSILAGEVGCVSLSPFCHELKVHFEESYNDTKPIMGVCVEAQRYYQQNGMPTKVKACSTIGLGEILQLAGVAAMTVMPHDIRALASTIRDEEMASITSFFDEPAVESRNVVKDHFLYADNEAKYRIDFSAAQGGKGQFKLTQALAIFCDYQDKSEAWIKSIRGSKV